MKNNTKPTVVDWISVEDRLPLEEYRGQKCSGEFLVTVYPDDMDPNEDPIVFILWFNCEQGYFSFDIGGEKYENRHAHYVTHWAELPYPAKIITNINN